MYKLNATSEKVKRLRYVCKDGWGKECTFFDTYPTHLELVRTEIVEGTRRARGDDARETLLAAGRLGATYVELRRLDEPPIGKPGLRL